MTSYYKKIFLIVVFVFSFTPILLWAQEEKVDVVFQAKVLEVVDEQNTKFDDGSEAWQQNLKLEVLNGDLLGKEIFFEGIGEVEVIKNNTYKVGERVMVVASYSDTGEATYYITDYARNKSLAWLFTVFVLSLLLIGGWKGLRAIISLVLSFFVIVYYIIPQIISGADAVIVTILGSMAILFIVVYVTEGFNKKSNIASLSIFISLIFTVFLAWLFVGLAKLSGLGSEEISYLITLEDVSINFKGLLLSGIIIGTLGVLDDVVISQVVTVEQIYEASDNGRRRDVFVSAYKVGISHISSMANTLFLAYAGASFPLLVLFFSGGSAFRGFFDVINNEAIATEIVRTLAGSIGLIFVVPISTALAVIFLKKT